MKWLPLLLALALAGAAAAEEHVPAHLDARKPAPLLLVLHCYGCDGAMMMERYNLAALSDAEGFLVAAPDGKRDAQGQRYWNASPACCDFARSGADDLATLRQVIASMRARHRVDPRRIFVFGFSNGGFMAHRLACELSKEIAAIASIGGGGFEPCRAYHPVAVLEIHGDADPVVPLDGGRLGGGLPQTGSFPPLRRTLEEWAHRDGCTRSSRSSTESMSVEKWGSCGVELWTLRKGGHQPPDPPRLMEQVVRFLSQHPKN